ncbi:MAG: hypothetical protein ACK5WF_18505 [Cyclobacteriaceae bacterium]
MFRTISASFLLLFIAFSSQAQEKKQRVKRPDFPGAFLIEFGFNRAQGSTPDNFEQGFWGSRTLNLYYQYPIRLWNSKFSYRPTFGLSLERYKLTNNYTLDRQLSGDGTYRLLPASELGMTNADKSMVIMNYLEIMPAEFRYDTKPNEPGRSIHITAGVRLGVLFETHTKVNYSINGESVTAKDAQPHGMSPVRLGYYGKVGIGSFSLFGYYNATPIFQENKGPNQTKMNTLTIGISLSGF